MGVVTRYLCPLASKFWWEHCSIQNEKGCVIRVPAKNYTQFLSHSCPMAYIDFSSLQWQKISLLAPLTYRFGPQRKWLSSYRRSSKTGIVCVLVHRCRNQGGTGGMCPPMFHKLLCKLLTTLCVVSDCAPPIKKSFLRPWCKKSPWLPSKASSTFDFHFSFLCSLVSALPLTPPPLAPPTGNEKYGWIARLTQHGTGTCRTGNY